LLSLLSIYTFLFCLFVCPFVSNTSQQLNWSGPNFVWDLAWPQGRFMDAQNYKKLYLKLLQIFVKFKKCAKKYLKIRHNFTVIVLYCTKRRCSQIKPQLKIKILLKNVIKDNFFPTFFWSCLFLKVKTF